METVPFLDLKELFERHRAAYLGALTRTMENAAFIGGDEVRHFEQEFAQWIGHGTFAVGCANGTDAITLAAQALRLPPGSEAIVPAMTYAATAGALVQAGFSVRLVDVDARTGLMDVAQLASAVGTKTKLVVPVHLYGQMVEMDRVRKIADARGLRVIEDAAQAHGARWKDQSVAHWGDAATFSFYPSKNLGAFGDAGAIASRDSDFLRRCRALGNQGGLAKYEHDFVGMNSRLDGVQATVLSLRLGFIDEWNERRRAIARMYAEALGDIEDLTLPFTHADATHVFHLYVVRAKDRDGLREHLTKHGIETGMHYPKAIHEHRPYATGASFPNAERFAREGLSLPIGPTLRDAQVGRVVAAVRSFFRG